MTETADRTTGNSNGNNELKIGGLVRVSRLDDMRRIRAELGRLYREARRRHGRYPDALTAQRLANVLGSMRTMIELEDIERRLRAIEEADSASRP